MLPFEALAFHLCILMALECQKCKSCRVLHFLSSFSSEKSSLLSLLSAELVEASAVESLNYLKTVLNKCKRFNTELYENAYLTQISIQYWFQGFKHQLLYNDTLFTGASFTAAYNLVVLLCEHYTCCHSYPLCIACSYEPHFLAKLSSPQQILLQLYITHSHQLCDILTLDIRIPALSNSKIRMDFANLTMEQNNFLYKVIKQAVIDAQNEFFNYGLDLNLLEMLKAFLKYFMCRPEIRMEGVLRTVLQMCILIDNAKDFIDDIVNTIKCNNLAGNLLSLRADDQMVQYYQYRTKVILQQYSQQGDQLTTLMEKMFQDRFQNDLAQNAKYKHSRTFQFVKKAAMYTRGFGSCQKNKFILLSKYYRFNKQRIDQTYQQLKAQNDLDLRQKALIKVYDEYINKSNELTDKYTSYQFMQYLLNISAKEFQDEFQVKDDASLDMLGKLIKEREVKNVKELRMKASIAKHVEYSEIRINFSYEFKIENIPNGAVVSMLDNVENRIQLINGSIYNQFIIIRRVPDNKILKSMIDDDNKQQVEDMLQKCSDGQLYDVIIKSDITYENFENLRIRYLSYINSYKYYIEITLSHPEDLVSASLCYIKISNVNECVNLKNLCSIVNTYTKQDIQPLHNLKRIQSVNDKYRDRGACLLVDLFKKNKLEYVYIYNYTYISNVVESFTMSANIENLKFVKINQQKAAFNITLDVSNQVPENLAVYDVVTSKKVNIYTGILVDPLITFLKSNNVQYLHLKEINDQLYQTFVYNHLRRHIFDLTFKLENKSYILCFYF